MGTQARFYQLASSMGVFTVVGEQIGRYLFATKFSSTLRRRKITLENSRIPGAVMVEGDIHINVYE